MQPPAEPFLAEPLAGMLPWCFPKSGSPAFRATAKPSIGRAHGPIGRFGNCEDLRVHPTAQSADQRRSAPIFAPVYASSSASDSRQFAAATCEMPHDVGCAENW